MTEPTFDRYGYPTDVTLDALRNWPADDVRGALEFMRKAWSYPEYARTHGDRGYAYEFLTGGWSGNESLVSALRENGGLWGAAWHFSRRGGLHLFEVPAGQRSVGP